jgi:HAD superfamily hydrolase (TIGR01458 family)
VAAPTGVRGVLLDVDGTLLDGDAEIPGAAAAVGRLRAGGVPFRAVTNTTRRSRAEIAAALARAGIEIAATEILTPAILARRRVVESGANRAALLVPPGARADFTGVEIDEVRPAWVVLGDLGRGFDYETVNRAFRWLMDGARLLALQRNRYWKTSRDGLLIDAGAFVAALEFAAGVEAEVVGKPAPGFFELALAELGIEADAALMVGDDAATDGRGASAVGCRVALVRTGKFDPAALAGAGWRPDLLLDSIDGLQV